MSAGKVDVLAVMGDLYSHGGTFEPRRIVPEWVRPISTGLLANRARVRTPVALRALQAAERAGDVECCGTGEQHNRAWNKSAAAAGERYWQLTNAALARIGGDK